MKENWAGILVNLSLRIVFSIDSVLFVSIFVPLTEVFRCTFSNLLRWRLHHRHQHHQSWPSERFGVAREFPLIYFLKKKEKEIVLDIYFSFFFFSLRTGSQIVFKFAKYAPFLF